MSNKLDLQEVKNLIWINKFCCLTTNRASGIETKVVTRPQFTNEILDWADAVFTAGGDGTFLDAASKIHNRDKPIIGVNTDPKR